MRTKEIIIALALCLVFFSCTTEKRIISSAITSSQNVRDYMTIDEAVANLKLREAVAPLASDIKDTLPLPFAFRPPYRPIEPVKIFDQVYFVGTATVGSFVVDTGDGLVMMDTGIGDDDAAIMVDGLKKLGLDPAAIKLILISHEHFDHYGGVQYIKKICPDAKVAMSLIGWNMLQSVPSEWAYISKRPQSVDIFLADGMKIKVGSNIFQIVATPGHSPGCVSFIFQVEDNGEKHVAGVMGGSAVWPTQVETQLYKSSIEYFKAFAKAAKCDVGLNFHSSEKDFSHLRARKPGEPNPLVIGQDKFDTVFLKKFRDRYQQMKESGSIAPYKPL